MGNRGRTERKKKANFSFCFNINCFINFFCLSLLKLKTMATASKVFLSFLLINLSSFFNPCLCDGGGGGGSSDGGGGSGSVDLDQILPGLGQNAIANAQCMHQLLPCQPFLKAPNDPPPTCCDPLKEMVTNSSDCLCQFINNPTMILSLEVSKDDIMKLPKACGIKVDISKCNANAGN